MDVTKDPNARLDFAVDWSKWLPSGDTISSSEWLAPEGITVDTSSINGTTTIAWISGGAKGRTYAVTNRVTTSAGRIDDRTLRITIADR